MGNNFSGRKPPIPSSQHAQVVKNDARARQLLPFVKTRLTDQQRSRLVEAIRAASTLSPQSESAALDIMAGAALVACSLETSRHVQDFLSAEISLTPTAFDPFRYLSDRQGLCVSKAGNMAWLLKSNGPKLVSTDNIPRHAGVWIPVSTVTMILLEKSGPSLARMVADHKAVQGEEKPKSSINPHLRPFDIWCARMFGLNVKFNLLDKIADDLANRLANAPQCDAAIARIITSKLTRETVATSHYTSLTRERAARHVVQTLSSLEPPAMFPQGAFTDIPEPRVLLGAPRTFSHAELHQIIDQYSQPALPIINAEHADLMEFHNTLTLRVWLMTSLAVGARRHTTPLLNPDNILPGNLVLVNDKEAKAAGNPNVNDVQREALIPKSRVVALPDHVADQIRSYGEHMDRLRDFFETGSKPRASLDRWFDDYRTNARWEPVFWQPRDDTGKIIGLSRFLRLRKKAGYKKIGQKIMQIHGNHWRHYLRSELLDRVPSEIIDAHLGHWQEAQGPWWEGACLDPVETWNRIRDATEMLLPAANWPVLKTPLPAAKHPKFVNSRAHNQEWDSTDQNGVVCGEDENEPPSDNRLGHTPLIDLFRPDRSVINKIAFILEDRHLDAVKQFARSDSQQKEIDQNSWPGFVLVSAMLWAGLINPNTWKPFLEAVVEAKHTANNAPITQVQFRYPVDGIKRPLPQTLYLDPIPSWLCSTWVPEPIGPVSDVLKYIIDWLNADSQPDQAVFASMDKASLRDALEIRARLRLPGILVDYASGRNPSPAWNKEPTQGAKKFDADNNPYDYPNKRYFRKILTTDDNALTLAQGLRGFKKMAALEVDRAQKDKLNRYDTWKFYRMGLDDAFHAVPLSAINRTNAANYTLEEVLGRFLREMATTSAKRGESPLYGGAKLEPGDLLKIARKCYRLLHQPLPTVEKLNLAKYLDSQNPLATLLEIKGTGQAPIDRQPQTKAITSLVHVWINSTNDKVAGRFERGLAEALCRIANPQPDAMPDENTFNSNLPKWVYKEWGQLNQKEPKEDDRATASMTSYPLVTAKQYAAALDSLAAMGETKHHASSIAARKSQAPVFKRKADICRIAAILMFRAGVRPHELSGLMLDDLSMLCTDAVGSERSSNHADVPDPDAICSADLLITANMYLKQKTRFSRRLIPLDVLLEPEELKLLREWQSLRLIESGGQARGELLFDLAPGDPARRPGMRLRANWILVPIANALVDAGCHREYTSQNIKGQNVDKFCHRLRHTAATCLMATLLLPNDAVLPVSAQIPDIIPALISPARRNRLAPRLLGTGRSGRSAAHAVARIMGHSDLVTLRSTYIHLMDWSLGMACCRPALQPPLPREVLTQVSHFLYNGNKKIKRNLNPATMREDARRHHLLIPLASPHSGPTVKLILPQYRRAGRGRHFNTAGATAAIDCGYLGQQKGTGFARLPKICIVENLALLSSPEPQDVADLVIRASKSGLTRRDMERRFGIDAKEAQRLLERWGELVQIKGILRRKEDNGPIAMEAFYIYRPIAQKNWNHLKSVPVQSARNQFSASFRKYCHSLTEIALRDRETQVATNQMDVPPSRSNQLKADRAVRMLLMRRNPHNGSFNLRFETGNDVRRYLDWFRLRIEASADGAVQFTANPIQRYNDAQPLRISLTRANVEKQDVTEKACHFNSKRWVYEETDASKWAAYALLLHVITDKRDLKPFLQATELYPSYVKQIITCLSPSTLPDRRVLPIAAGSRLYTRLSNAKTERDKRSSGLVSDPVSNQGDAVVYLFRLVGLDGRVAAGTIQHAQDRPGVETAGKNLRIDGYSWQPRRYSAKSRHLIAFGLGQIGIARPLGGTLSIYIALTPVNATPIGVVKTALSDLKATEISGEGELCWHVDPSMADTAEARLFAAVAPRPVAWTKVSSKRHQEQRQFLQSRLSP